MTVILGLTYGGCGDLLTAVPKVNLPRLHQYSVTVTNVVSETRVSELTYPYCPILGVGAATHDLEVLMVCGLKSCVFSFDTFASITNSYKGWHCWAE